MVVRRKDDDEGVAEVAPVTVDRASAAAARGAVLGKPVSQLTDRQRDQLAALQAERAGYVRRGLPDRVAQVDACIARLG